MCRKGGGKTLTFHLEVVGLRNVEQVVPVPHLEGVAVALLVDEGDPALLAGFGRLDVPVPSGARAGEGPVCWRETEGNREVETVGAMRAEGPWSREEEEGSM